MKSDGVMRRVKENSSFSHKKMYFIKGLRLSHIT